MFCLLWVANEDWPGGASTTPGQSHAGRSDSGSIPLRAHRRQADTFRQHEHLSRASPYGVATLCTSMSLTKSAVARASPFNAFSRKDNTIASRASTDLMMYSHYIAPFGVPLVLRLDVGTNRNDLEVIGPRIGDHVLDKG